MVLKVTSNPTNQPRKKDQICDFQGRVVGRDLKADEGTVSKDRNFQL